MRIEIVGIYTEPREEAKVITLKRPILHTTVKPNGEGFVTEATNKILKRRRTFMCLGLPAFPLSSKKEPIR